MTFVTLAGSGKNTGIAHCMDIREIAAQALQDAMYYLPHIDHQVYSMPLDLLSGASVGQHTRHFVEFYQCLLQQIDTPDQVINYALRKRDLHIETDPDFAAHTIAECCNRLASLRDNPDCTLVCDEHVSGGHGVTVQSNLARELVYNIEHTIHHLAIIKIGLHAIAPQITLPPHFGVAPSTIRHRDTVCAQ